MTRTMIVPTICALTLILLTGEFNVIAKVSADPMSRSTVTSEERVKSTCHHPDLTHFLIKLVKRFPNIARLTSIGNSTEGRELWTVVITSDPQLERPLLKPQVKLVGNINGNSGPACVTLLKLIQFLLENYETDEELKMLMDNVEIHILPNLNPDGYSKSVPGECFGRQGRLNANDVDLNRNFPDMFQPEDSQEVDYKAPEPETAAVINWMKENSFIVSASLISGAIVVSYPWDAENPKNPGYGRGRAHTTPDDETFKMLARNYVGYVDEQNSMNWYCPSVNRIFPEGFINGAEWHSVSGSMLDYNYVHGTFELLICLSCCRNDNNTEILEDLWENHKLRLLTTIESAALSLRGQVVDATTGLALEQVEIVKEDYRRFDDGKAMPFFSNSRGEFWRIVLPGKYTFKFFLRGYENVELTLDITDKGSAPQLFIRMEPVNNRRRRKPSLPASHSQSKAEAEPQTATITTTTMKNIPFETTGQSTNPKMIENEAKKEDSEWEIGEGFPQDFHQFLPRKTSINFTNILDTSALHELKAYGSPPVSQQQKQPQKQRRQHQNEHGLDMSDNGKSSALNFHHTLILLFFVSLVILH